jgi:alkaline phosphatase D
MKLDEPKLAMLRILPAVAALLAAGLPAVAADAPPYLGNGVKVGEVTDTTAIIWARLTRTTECAAPDFVQPGMDGYARLTCYRADLGEGDSAAYPQLHAEPANDHVVQFKLKDLQPGREYRFYITTTDKPNGGVKSMFRGRFRTAPASDQPARVVFTVTTGHRYKTIDDPGKGQKIYPAMGQLEPNFFVHTGDVVYYDSDTPPLAKSVDLARLHWHRMYALPNQIEFHRNIPSYFIKDDHDTLKNDCWAGQTYGDLTFAQGQAIFREQVPMGKKTYRTIRWGKDVQIWLPEGRDFRSPNGMDDGPDKTIWGAEQIAWFKRTMEASDATFKIVISPTPIVGPDRARGKNDNHANAAFQTEGDWLREYLADHHSIVANGDRHWQYHTVDDKTGLQEFCSGPSTNQHAGGFSQDRKTDEHRFLRVKGGFLSVTVDRVDGKPTATFRHHDVDGNVVYERALTPDQLVVNDK